MENLIRRILKEEVDQYSNIMSTMGKLLSKEGIQIDMFDGNNINLIIDNNTIGTFRYDVIDNWVVMENIELNEDFIGSGIGFFIYESLYLSSKENGLNGLFSTLYSEEISQQRSEQATNVLNKLLSKYGGESHDVSQWLDDDHMGEDVYDILIDGSKNVRVKKV